MAITKLMHMKEAQKGNKAAHLKNAIKYILDEEKTEGGLLVGGIGCEWREVYQTFFETKQNFGKMDGRQGYHFVVSFPPGETDKETVCRIMDEFCEKLLGNSYEYVWAVHTDTDHLHGHVIFNSVSRETGIKYHYSNGDWEKMIQPITNDVCKKHGLPELEISAYGNNKNYAEWERQKRGCMNQRDLLRCDIDEILQYADSYEEFLAGLEAMGYKVRAGQSEKHGTYLSFTPPGSRNAFRSYTLGKGYSVLEIKQRAARREPKEIHAAALPMVKARPLSAWRFRKLYITNRQVAKIRSYYKGSVMEIYQKGGHAKDRNAINRIVAECDWMARCGIGDARELSEYLNTLNEQELYLKGERSRIYRGMEMFKTELPLLKEYQELLNEISQAGDEDFEKLDDRLMELEREIPAEKLSRENRGKQEELKSINRKLSVIYRERRMAKRILKKTAKNR